MRTYWSKVLFADQIEHYVSIDGDILTFGNRGAHGEQVIASVPKGDVPASLGEQIARELGDHAWEEILTALG